MRRRTNGFTILELTMVVAIIGLIMGALVIGQDVIFNSKITSVVAEVEKYRSATETFYDQYQQLPGDFNNAQDQWGAKASCAGAGLNVRSATSATCNGDGDGIMDSTATAEPFCFWQHLENAALLTEDYSCATGDGTNFYVPGTDIGKISKFAGGWIPGSFSATINDLALTSYNILNTVTYGTFTVTDALAIETKLDDGAPGTGNVQLSNAGGCVSGGAYVTTYQKPDCNLKIRIRN